MTNAEEEMEEEDYLSDKFLLAASQPSHSYPIPNSNSKNRLQAQSRTQSQMQMHIQPKRQPLTYSERRREAMRESEARNLAGRVKSRREREEESREEGLRVSLFERARREEEEAEAEARALGRPGAVGGMGRGGGMGKALGLMKMMGYREGEALGAKPALALEKEDDDGEKEEGGKVAETINGRGDGDIGGGEEKEARAGLGSASTSQHRKVPLPVDVWTGKKGVGLGKRAPSPGLAERAAKVLKEDEKVKHENFRDRTRSAFEERKIMGQLSNAIKTLQSLDDKSGVQFNVLALDPQDPTSIPPELLDALAAATVDTDDLTAGGIGRDHSFDGLMDTPTSTLVVAGENEKERLRREMQRDALQPLGRGASGDDDEEEGFAMVANGVERETKNTGAFPVAFSDEAVLEARSFLQLLPGDRLSRVLGHLRSKYHYCLWCGTQYDDQDDLDSNCPGPDEDLHD